MKTIIFATIGAVWFILGSTSHSNAQQHSGGLYITWHDYLDHKLSYVEDTSTKIYFHELFGGSNVTVVSKRKKIILAKDKLFGYHDSAGDDFRFSGGDSYQVVDTAGFFIYRRDQVVQRGKGSKPTAVYYFSKKVDGRILPLTFYNVSKAFFENSKFRYMLELASASLERPEAIDSEQNQYKIKELYLKSLQQ